MQRSSIQGDFAPSICEVAVSGQLLQAAVGCNYKIYAACPACTDEIDFPMPLRI